MNSSKTSVVCYFCNVTFENAYLLQGHIKQCGSILRQCNRCKVYTERRHYDSHNRQCLKREIATLPTSGAQNKYNDREKYRSSINGDPRLEYNLQTLPYTQSNLNALTAPSFVDEVKSQLVVSVPQTVQNNKQEYLIPQQADQRNKNVPSTLPTQNQNARHSMYEGRQSQNRYSGIYEKTEVPIHRDGTPGIQYLKNELDALKQRLEEEITAKEHLRNEINKMKKQYLLSEERNQILLSTISTLRRNIEDESHRFNITNTQINNELEGLRLKYQDLTVKSSQLEMTLNSLQKDQERDQIERSHMELIVNGQDSKLRILNKIETDLESLRNNLIQEQQVRKDLIAHLQNEMEQTKDSYTRNISIIKQELKSLEVDQNDSQQKLQSNSEDISKIEALSAESKATRSTVKKDSNKIKEMEETLKEVLSSVAMLQRERYISRDVTSSPADYYDMSGHLLWKLEDYDEKMKDSIENESILLSPIFYSDRYGYAMQAEIHLNGLGKWRGRHICASVVVVPGKWDQILQWPLQLTASISIKDQTPKRSQAMDIAKTLLVRKKDHTDDEKRTSAMDGDFGNTKRKSLENLSTVERENRALDASIKKQYVFIPHTSLNKFDYVKKNTMFVEIKVTNNSV